MRQQEYNEIQDIKRGISLFVIALIAFMSLMVISAEAKINDCEEVSRSNADKYSMGIVWIQYLDANGAYIFDGKNGAHIINSKVLNGKRYYFDFSSPASEALIFNSKTEVNEYYKMAAGYDNEIYIIGVDNIPFSTYWDR